MQDQLNIITQQIREFTLLSTLYNKKPQLFSDLRQDNFPVPMRVLNKKENETISTADSFSSIDTKAINTSSNEQKISLNKCFNFSLVLTNNGKKVEKINEGIAFFNEKVLDNCSIEEYQKFQINTIKLLEVLELSWKEMKFQQAES